MNARVEQSSHGICAVDFARLLAEFHLRHQFRPERHSVRRKRLPVTFKTAVRRADLGAADVRNRGATGADQVFGSLESDVFVVHADEIGPEPREPAVNQDEWNVTKLLLRQSRVLVAARS